MSRDTPREASFQAEHGLLTVRVLGYESPDLWTKSPSLWDTDWLLCEMEIVAGPAQTFRSVQRLTVEADHFGQFCRDLRLTAEGRTEDAALFHSESSAFAAVEIQPGEDIGTLDALVHNTAGAATFLEDVVIDRNTIRRAAREFNALAAAFPPRIVGVE